MNLTDQITQLWTANTPPVALPTLATPTKLPPLPKPLQCELNHHNQSNWKYGPDRHGRVGFWRVTCKSCGRFWGYAAKTNKPKRSKQ